MDRLDKAYLMPVLLAHAQKRATQLTGKSIAVVFYDVTTLYFETDEEDADNEEELGLRRLGYSKDHRGDLPQVVVGLTVDSFGFPIDFQVYEGNTYEGHTLLDGIRRITSTLSLSPSSLMVVADAGMLSRKNIEDLETNGYRYIVGARLKSLSESETRRVLDFDYATCGPQEIPQGTTGRRLVVTYSEKRAKRSGKNRDRLIRKLQAGLNRGQVVRKSKYGALGSDEKLTGSIDHSRLDEESRFDGLKGYVTNTLLPADEVVRRYGELWNVEKSFRMSKSDLQARPTFHYLRKRILAHLLICVCALTVLRELELRLRQSLPETGLSIALEELLAIRKYVLHIPNQPDSDVYSELSTIGERLLEI
jgi:transposase